MAAEESATRAQELKDLGNKEYKAGAYLKAAGLYTKAIKADPTNHVLYSNRCAALLQLSKITKALADAEMAIKINPTWGKVRLRAAARRARASGRPRRGSPVVAYRARRQGYYRKGAALEGAGRLDDALEAYKEAGELEPSNCEFSIKIKNVSRQIRASKPKAAGDAAGANGQRARPGAANGGAGAAAARPQHSQNGARAAGGLRTEEDVAAAVADYKKDTANTREVAYSDKRVYAWGRATLDDAMARYAERRGKMDPFALLLPGKAGGGPGGEDAGENFEVSIRQAFDSPDMLSNCVEFIRKYADDTGSHAAAVVVPRAAISYPQVWKGLGAKQWKHGAADGFFVQLESRSDRRVWFVPTQTRQGAAIDAPTEYHALDAEVYRLVPALFR